MTLTDEQVRALATAQFTVDGRDVVMGAAWCPTSMLVPALATEVLAQRARRCGTCLFRQPDRYCAKHGRWPPPDWFCADWCAKETR